MLSNVANTILNSKKGYRTEQFSGSKTRNFKDVIYFEMVDLANTDIIDFFGTHYDPNIKIQIDETTANELKKEAKDECEYLSLLYDWESDYLLENHDYFFNNIYNYLSNLLGSVELYCIWLTTHQNVIDIYHGDVDTIDEYLIPNDAIIISDLGSDGCLFVSKEMFFPNKQKELCCS